MYPSLRNYDYGLIPGPTKVPEDILQIYGRDYPSSDLEDSFFEEYENTTKMLADFLQTKSNVVIMTGEAMVCLWGALKSVLSPGDRVLALNIGVFGKGIGEMAESIGAKVEYCNFHWHKGLSDDDIEVIKQTVKKFNPTMITAVHCDTPTGWFNTRIGDIGKISKEFGSLFYVDFVSSFAGTPILIDEWNVDLGLFGSQKCLNCPPDFGMISVSEKAWEYVEKVRYCGYDAILPFKFALKKKFFDYTPSWRAILSISTSIQKMKDEGLENVYKRHLDSKNYCIQRLENLGLQIYVEDVEWSSPTVTAVKLPKTVQWTDLDKKLREKGVTLGGTFGDVENLLFRIGHMGIQANLGLLKKAMDTLEDVLKEIKS